ncbi:probable protein phosphatase 2C 33 [Zingiber officinale]|uniref:PPM-type phosphatase domain-containing protein n=1 Tax=Zingiber officinale TaxID=94328 RepID=A0A8J5II09_ZINOF|nr:probable protein phosphatase 2C 33 [Zingiber officinale]XP_042430671.1 probable protein phosphatase 2C 33 [Zingiber officinale]KAG6535460.1 hypothetical protein ZIOFF_000433 [Zingiber officinale]
MECILEVIRTLPMGSCLSSDGWSSGRNPSSPASPASGARRQGGGIRRRRPSPEEEELDGIWERMCRNGATSAASLFTQQGKKGTNQDAMIVWENFGDRSDTIFCGVFDGHGPNGHMVARKVRDILPLNLCANLQLNAGNHDLKENNINIMNSEAIPSTIPQEDPRPPNGCDEKDRHSKFFKALKVSFLKTFRIVDKELRLHPEIDCFLSGTTAVTLVKQGEDLVIGNVGDSRAVLGTRDENNCLIAVQLTTDLKPSLPREAERIRRHRGRVFALKNEPEVARVWLPNMNSPGLAMARAFGDFCLKDFGLISVPEVSYRRVTAKDEFIVLATDGVWDVLSNKDVVSIVASAPTRSSSACSLVESAARAWKLKYPTSKTDDCAVVCLFLNLDKPNSTVYRKDDQLNSIEVVSFYQSNGKHA